MLSTILLTTVVGIGVFGVITLGVILYAYYTFEIRYHEAVIVECEKVNGNPDGVKFSPTGTKLLKVMEKIEKYDQELIWAFGLLIVLSLLIVFLT